MLYKRVIRPLFFLTDPEWIHNLAIKFLKFTSENRRICNILRKFFFVDKKMEVKVGNLILKNPIGLAAGFDKNIEAPLAYSMLGFGFAEFGSVTLRAHPGNDKPRLWRLPKDNSLIVYYGLCNQGAAAARRRLKSIKSKMDIPFGISIATIGTETQAMVNDYANAFYELHKYVDFVTLNISCPNVTACDFTTQIDFIERLLALINGIKKKKNIDKDFFVKIGPDMKEHDLDRMIEFCLSHGVSAVIATNLLKDRKGTLTRGRKELFARPGGLSGKILRQRSNETIRYIHKKSGGKLKIIGVGGVFTAQDVYEKFKCGACAVQMITGFIYGGPFVVKKINKKLAENYQEKSG